MNIKDFAKVTLEELNSLAHDEVNALDETMFMEYIHRSRELGNEFMFKGVRDKYTLTLYGSTLKSLEGNGKSGWHIMQGFGLLPTFQLKPIMVNKEEFAKRMKELGVSDQLLKECFEYKPDSTGF